MTTAAKPLTPIRSSYYHQALELLETCVNLYIEHYQAGGHVLHYGAFLWAKNNGLLSQYEQMLIRIFIYNEKA